MPELTHLSLFSGIGGLDLAAEWAGFKTVGQVELGEYQTAVLARHWPNVERWQDVRDFTIHSFEERTGIGTGEVNLLTGGPPCQPFSLAGNRRASGDERDMWPEYFRVVGEIRPRWCVAENVRGLLTAEDGRYFRGILRQFTDLGYCVAWGLIRACDAGAPHQRERICFVAHTNKWTGDTRNEREPNTKAFTQSCADGTSGFRQLAHAQGTSENGRFGDANAAGFGGFTDSGTLEHTGGTGRQECHAAPISGETGHLAGGHYPGNVGDTLGEGQTRKDDISKSAVPPKPSKRELGAADSLCRDTRGAEPEGQLGETRTGGASGCISKLADTDRGGHVQGKSEVNTAETGERSQPRLTDSGLVDNTGCLGCAGSDRRGNVAELADRYPRQRRAAKPGLGGLLDGISARLDAQRWPAAKGQPQFDWEPPRTGFGIPDRAKRLTGDGNAVVPEQFYPVMALIAEYERRTEHEQS